MSETTPMRAPILLLVLLGACDAEPQPTDSPTPTAAATPSPSPVALPPGMAVADGPLFRLDTTTERIPFELGGVTVVGRLGRDGRRSLELEVGDEVTVLSPADWVLPPAGAGSDPLLVCWNRLVGEPSGLTEGAMPDPRGGVALVCRRRAAGVWSGVIDVVPERPIAWLRGVDADGDGFLIDYQVDAGLLVQATADGHGRYRRRLAASLGPEEVVLLADPETFPR